MLLSRKVGARRPGRYRGRAFAGWAITTVVTMLAFLSLRSNTWMNDTTPRDALGLGGDLWVAVMGGTSVAGGVSVPGDPDADWGGC